MEVTLNLNYYLFFAIGVLIVLSILLYKEFIRQKNYYKRVIDNSTCMLVIADRKNILEVNKTFFTYFHSFSNITEFLKKHKSIGDFFEEEEGCLKRSLDGTTWIEYLVKNQGQEHKVKMNIEDKIYYFEVFASVIDAKHAVFSLTFSDISQKLEDEQALELLTMHDSLTKIGNRRFFDQKLQEYMDLARRYNTSFSLIIIDIDFFKKINDQYGHDIGDKVLIDFTTLIKNNLRVGDIFSRVGGEEFAIILPLTTNDKAYTLAQKLRILVKEFKGFAPVTLSAGLVQYEKGDDQISIFKRADSLLYKAKESGRDRVMVG